MAQAHIVNLDSLRKFCGTLPGATRDIKWGADEVYSVGTKMFAVFWIERAKAKTVSFKVDDERFLELTDRPGIMPAPYLARAHWIQICDPKGLGDVEVRALVARSHALVMSKLPRKLRDGLTASPRPARKRPKA